MRFMCKKLGKCTLIKVTWKVNPCTSSPFQELLQEVYYRVEQFCHWTLGMEGMERRGLPLQLEVIALNRKSCLGSTLGLD